ncbi:AT-rich interactive domain-containing protein 4-like [Aristolochia californica]|uniref:AT-rich interactive domain-containing protein 4-like n=1 Tax=Aristolochia californica TaxID=171875 RepID=UPI0035E054AD
MFQPQGTPKQTCSLLAIFCGKTRYERKPYLEDGQQFYPFPELVPSGRLEVQTLNNPSIDEFRHALDSHDPNFVYLQGEQLLNEEDIGPLVWGGVNISTPEAIAGLFKQKVPSTVYLEVPNGEKLAEALHVKGIPYVIYWRNSFSSYSASHFRQAFFSVVQSSCSHTWDAFQLAHASFGLYCVRNNEVSPSKSQKVGGKPGPRLLGEPPKINIILPEKVTGEEDEDSPTSLPEIKIYDDEMSMRFLVCGAPCTLDACLLGSLEDGLNALLNIEIRGSKLHNRVSATPPPLQAGAFSRGVVTMKCDLSTCSLAHISLLVSGSAQTCFDDQLLEAHIKNELIEKSQLVHALPSCEESKPSSAEPRKSTSIACGASVFEVCMKVPAWASQVLRQLAPDGSYRSLVALGIASIHGISVGSFEKEDADRLLFFCKQPGKVRNLECSVPGSLPSWFKLPAPSRKGLELSQDFNSVMDENWVGSIKLEEDLIRTAGSVEEISMPIVPVRQKRKVPTMRPVPHTRQHKLLPFSGIPEVETYDTGLAKPNLSIVPAPKNGHLGSTPVTHRKALSSTYQAQQIISLNPLPLKKHGCGRCPIQACSEEEFLRDVMQFLILRGHTRLVPQGGLAEFPDAILNAKRLDLYNLYREVVSRGGFHVGNGINWKGQVFSKMRNHTMTNRMTGVGNTLKRHYETYLLEYELAHDDVDGECCLLCHSSAAGDWVNCGICGEWAHFGCDRRQGLGAFKDYAKTDGLEYVCPHCSLTNFKRKSHKTSNGFSQP